MFLKPVRDLSGYFTYNGTKVVMCSALTQGPDGIFGWCVQTDSLREGEQEHGEFVFLEWDVYQDVVQETVTLLPYRYTNGMHLHYDPNKDCWLLAVNGHIRALPGNGASYSVSASDLFTISRSQPSHWSEPSRIPKVKPEREGQTVQRLWSRGEQYPVLLRGFWSLDVHTRLYYRPGNPIDQGQTRLLERGFFFVPVVFETTFLILSCVVRRKSAHWGYRITAYQTDGTRLRQQWVPDITFASQQEKWYLIDDFDRLQPQFVVCEGPTVHTSGAKTCVAALLLQEYAHDRSSFHPHQAEESLDPLSSQGGLYWFDEQGYLLSRETSPYGEQIQLCLCGEKIIGVDRWNQQWRLWSWSPQGSKSWEIREFFSPTATRVDVLAIQRHDTSSQTGFWSIEEDPDGFTVSVWSTEPFERREQMRMDGLQLPSRLSGGTKALTPCGIAAYQDYLLLVSMNREGRLQLLTVSPSGRDQTL